MVYEALWTAQAKINEAIVEFAKVQATFNAKITETTVSLSENVAALNTGLVIVGILAGVAFIGTMYLILRKK